MWTSQPEGDQKPRLGAEDQLAPLQRPDICQGEISWATILFRPLCRGDLYSLNLIHLNITYFRTWRTCSWRCSKSSGRARSLRTSRAKHSLLLIRCPGALDWKCPTFVTYKRPLLQLMRLIVVTFATEIRSERNHPKTRDQARTFQWSKLLSK